MSNYKLHETTNSHWQDSEKEKLVNKEHIDFINSTCSKKQIEVIEKMIQRAYEIGSLDANNYQG